MDSYNIFGTINTIFKNTAVIFVSHSMPQVARMCDSVVNLDKGKCIHWGAISEGIYKYNMSFTSEISKAVVERIKLNSFLVNRKKSNIIVKYGEDINLELIFQSNEYIKSPVINIHIIDATQQYIYQVNNKRDSVIIEDIVKGENKYMVKLKEVQLNSGNYSFSIALRDDLDREFFAWYHAIASFKVEAPFIGNSQYQGKVSWID